MISIEEFMVRWCSPGLTAVQKVVADAMMKEGRLIGVSKAIGGTDHFPLVSFGKMGPSVIDGAGHYQLPSRESIKIFSPHDCVPWRGRDGEIGACVYCESNLIKATPGAGTLKTIKEQQS